MKRNRFGINLDEGVPLITQDEFDLLYVPYFGEASERFMSWLAAGNKPLLLGGQIGSGKSTLITKAIRDTGQHSDITLHFDQKSLNSDAGDFWSIALTGFVQAALGNNIDLGFCKLPEELGPYGAEDWQGLIEGLEARAVSLAAFTTKINLRKKVAEQAPYIGMVIAEIGLKLQAAIEKPLFVFASGLDKFDPLSPALFAMQDVVATLTAYKTLFEVNATHLFQKPGSSFHSLDRVFITLLEQKEVMELLRKRMGHYSRPIKRELEIIAQWSGGNPRQALRLLSHFETSRKNRNRTIGESIAFAIRETTGDFFSYSSKPSTDLVRTIQRTGTINTTTLTLPGDKDTALRALYGNWIFIGQQKTDIAWTAVVNPLVKNAFAGNGIPEDPETRLLRVYADVSNISAAGLGLQRFDEKNGNEKSGDQLLREFFAAGVDHPIYTNLSETFDVLAGALLSKDRSDRAILAVRDMKVAEAARAYLFAKANSYDYQRCRHVVITGGPDMHPIAEMEAFFSEDTDIFSIEFSGKWESAQLEALDKQRDRFITSQMLWWIPFDDLKQYLPYWTQLRQLFELFVLEDELLGSISEEEVQADLVFFEDLPEDDASAEANVVQNLKIVLEYLKTARGGNHRG